MLSSAAWAAARRMLSSSGGVAPLYQSVRAAPRGLLLRHAMPSVRMISISTSMRMPAAATAKAKAKPKPKPKAKAEPKSTASATKKTTAKKTPASKTAAKKTTKAKPKPKSKATSAEGKKKAIKKPKKKLTPEEKEKADLRGLKKMAMLKAPTLLPDSAWSLYVASNLPKGEGDLAEKIKLVAASYKNLPESEKERLNAIAQSNKAANKDTRTDWIKSHPPEAIYIANLARKRLGRKLDKSRVYLLHDDRLPKRSGTAFTFYIKTRFSQSTGKPDTDSFRVLSQEWKALSESEQAPYYDMAAVEGKKSKDAFDDIRLKGKEYWKAQMAPSKSKSDHA